MVRYFSKLAVCLALGCVGTWASYADETRELTVYAVAQDSQREANIGPVHLNQYGGVVIRSAAELASHSAKPEAAKDATMQQALNAELAKLFEVDAIDWNKQMVLAVRGEPGTKADRVHFDSFKSDGKTLTVTWKVKQRPPHAGTGTPLALVLVERFDGEVKFGQ